MTATHASVRRTKHAFVLTCAAFAALGTVGIASARPGDSCSAGTCPPSTPAAAATAVPQGPDRYIFCAVAGNTYPNGTPIAPGTALNLPADQAATDLHYAGATIGFFEAGVGATCQLTPAQAAVAAASTKKVNHVGGTGDINEPEIYTFVG